MDHHGLGGLGHVIHSSPDANAAVGPAEADVVRQIHVKVQPLVVSSLAMGIIASTTFFIHHRFNGGQRRGLRGARCEWKLKLGPKLNGPLSTLSWTRDKDEMEEKTTQFDDFELHQTKLPVPRGPKSHPKNCPIYSPSFFANTIKNVQLIADFNQLSTLWLGKRERERQRLSFSLFNCAKTN